VTRWPWASHKPDDARFGDTKDILRRYAASRDGMTDRQRERLRAATLAAFEAQLVARPERTPARSARRGFALGLALVALLALAGTVAAAESGPGQPLYGLRLTLESLTLPSGGSARTEALLAQLDRRLGEASQESERGNALGVADAVRAYMATLDEMSGGIGPGVSQTAVEAGLERHLTVLQRIQGSAPGNAQGGVQQALHQAELAQRALEQHQGEPARPSHPGPPQSPPGRP
jgi:hypothetical protein